MGKNDDTTKSRSWAAFVISIIKNFWNWPVRRFLVFAGFFIPKQFPDRNRTGYDKMLER